jgi:ABC-type spermidine/putrescine transport system permease subunit II
MEESTKKNLREATALAAKVATGTVVVATLLGYLEPYAGKHLAREAQRWTAEKWKELDEWVEKG